MSGADAGVYPPMSTVLVAAGIELHEGYDPARLARLAPDLVVVGEAAPRLEARLYGPGEAIAALEEYGLTGGDAILVKGSNSVGLGRLVAHFVDRGR